MLRSVLASLCAIMLIAMIYLDINEENIAEGASRAEGNILYVSETGSTWSSIQDALDNATSGDTVYIAPGNYSRGFLLLQDGITMIGNSSGDVNIRAPGEEAVIGISSDDSSISGLNIIEDGGHLNLLMISQCKDLTLKDITIESSLSHCMFVSDCTNISLENLYIDSGERQAIEFRDIWRSDLDGFVFVSSGSPDAIMFSKDCIGVRISNGTITMDDPDSIAFQSEDEIGLVIDNVSVTYQNEFIRMEMGTVVCYDTFFGSDDVNITSSSVNDTFTAYVRKELTAFKEERNGSMTPTEGVEINISSELGAEYRTPYYGGSDEVSSQGGNFIEPIEVMFFNMTGGGFPHTQGTASLEAFYPEADMNGTVVISEIDLSNKDTIILEFRDIWHTNGTIFGKVTYGVGPLNGSNVSKAVLGLGRDIDLTGLQVISSISEYLLRTSSSGI